MSRPHDDRPRRTKLDEVARQYDDLNAELALPETSRDLDALKRLGRELARLEPVVEAYRQLRRRPRRARRRPRAARRRASDDEMRSLAREEIERLEADEARARRRAQGAPAPARPGRRRQRHPRDPGRRRRRGGGAVRRRAAADVPRATPRNHGCRAEVMSLNETGIGGVKEAIVEIAGDGAYSRLKFEGGTHRVQRVPADRVVGPDPHLDRDGRRDARGRGDRDRDRRGPGPPDRRQALLRARAASR